MMLSSLKSSKKMKILRFVHDTKSTIKITRIFLAFLLLSSFAILALSVVGSDSPQQTITYTEGSKTTCVGNICTSIISGPRYHQNASGNWTEIGNIFRITKNSDDITFHYDGIEGYKNLTLESGVIYNGNYYSMADVKSFRPEIEFTFPSEKRRSNHKYAVNISNIANVINNTSYITLTYKSHAGFNLGDMVFSNNKINARQIALKFFDLIESGYTLRLNTTEKRVYIGNLSDNWNSLGDNLYLDPTVTLTTTAITKDGEVYSPDSTYNKDDINDAQVGKNPVGDIFRAYIEYDTSVIPDGTTIDEVWFNISVGGTIGALSTDTCGVYNMENQPNITGNNVTIYNDAGNGTAYNDSGVWCQSLGYHYINISNATGDLQSQLGADWFAVGLRSSEVTDDDYGTIETVESVNDSELWVMYSGGDTAPTVNITSPGNLTYICDSEANYINYTVSDDNGASRCWYSTDGGAINSSTVVAGINFTGITPGAGSLTWSVWCNDTIAQETLNKTILHMGIYTCSPTLLSNTRCQVSDDIVDSNDDRCIDASSITDTIIEGHNHIIDGDGDTAYGFSLDNGVTRANITLRNITFTDWKTAQLRIRANNNTFTNISISDSPWIGMWIMGASNYFYDIDIRNTTSSAFLSVTGGSYNIVTSLTCYETGSLCYSIRETGNELTNSTLQNAATACIGYQSSHNNTAYNNYINCTIPLSVVTSPLNNFTVTESVGTNIIGGTNLGGNFWTNPTKTGYSDTCADTDSDGFCDTSYTLAAGHVDYLPLTQADSSAPSIVIFSPANNSFVNGEVIIQAAASDDIGVTGVNFTYANSTMNYTQLCYDTSSPYTCTWDTTLDGNETEGYDINATSYDAAGNMGVNYSHYTIDRTKPQVKDLTVIYPGTQSSVRNSQNVTLKLNASDSPTIAAGINLTKIDLTNLNGTGNATMIFESGSTSANQWSLWNITLNISASTGLQDAHIYVYDNATPTNNLRNGDVFQVQVDNDVPTYSSLSDNGPIWNNTLAAFSVNAFDNFDLDNYIFSQNSTGTWANDSEVALSGIAESISVHKVIQTGTNNFSYKFYLFDDAGNMNETVPTNIEVYGNQPGFVIYLSSPLDGVNLTISEVNHTWWYENRNAINCSLFLDGDINETVAAPINATVWGFYVNMTDGEYDWFVECIEEDTNTSYQSNLRTYVIDTTAPNATLLTPVNNTATPNATTNFTANLTDNLGIKNATLYIYNSTSLVNETSTDFALDTVHSIFGITITLIDEVYNWFYSLFDWSGNQFTTENNTLTVDTTFPVVNIDMLKPNPAQYTVETVYFNWTAVDTNLVTAYFNVTNSTGAFMMIYNLTRNATIGPLIFPRVDTYYFQVWANDTAGNMANTSLALGVLSIADSDPPTLTIHTPTSGTSYTVAGISILLNVTANDTASSVSVAWWSQNGGTTNHSWDVDDSIPNWTTMTWNQVEGTTDSYAMLFCANDTYDNRNCTWSNLTIEIPATGLPQPGGGGGASGAWVGWTNESSDHDIPDELIEGPPKPSLIERVQALMENGANWLGQGNMTVGRILLWIIILLVVFMKQIAGKIDDISSRIKLRNEFR